MNFSLLTLLRRDNVLPFIPLCYGGNMSLEEGIIKKHRVMLVGYVSSTAVDECGGISLQCCINVLTSTAGFLWWLADTLINRVFWDFAPM